MADRIVIDLVEDEFNCEEVESYRDKIAKLEGKVDKMEQEINGIKEMIVNLKNYSNEDSYFSDIHQLSQNEIFENLSETSKNGENGRRHFNIETNQISFTNKLAAQLGINLVEMENVNETPYNLNHLKAYLDWLASIGRDNEFNMRLFVRTLTRSALMWYANQDTRK
ncbi:hypothetical protein R3W88_016046 [Solanum pinnatisectum]|uniref:Uncharacterized protein n=1 Tax=Solanum pinnatisectum TaxID=50273 RepID=A0AAV9KWZ5_9SOLN|nr:hypothetical protein R3W88_016046 [Solanum pinnatisectum]